jgi:hypothetical protein
MDEFILIITKYTNIEPTPAAAKEAILKGALNKFAEKEPNIFKKLKILLYQDTLNPFMETDMSKKALLMYKQQNSIEVRYDNFCA